ncbi:single-stranded DNA-binding protein [Acidihalobacter ferrooxydans]|uniref:Single-stranded DNA-binding protein n=1 Tax=Acidihalobacter ferrooxydans TaxID=1765967 RepID=A0A1P8UFP8_9GAMM|nr:single-stranded DNA-binding protein [Acidihalobacter ferrooxydans]APZ42611.1 hypothetical protein BW247_05460 [Acidihalobacter ferrooxydans]
MQIFMAMGHLGKDPEVKYLNSGSAVVNFSLATSKKWTDKNTGERMERTEWHRMVAFNKLAEVIGEYCHKGSKIFIRGELQTRKWTDKDGQDRYTTEIVVNEMEFAGGGSSGQSDPQQRPQRSSSRPQQSRPQQQPEPAGMPDFDDDVPF